MKLYTYFRSSSSFRVRIALNLKGIDYQPVFINLLEGEQRNEAHRQRNPLGLVPVLEDGSHVLGESTAIIEYLEEAQPEPRLLPNGTVARARVREMVQTIACDMQPLCNLAVLKYLRNPLGSDQAGSDAWYAHWMARGFTALEELTRRHGGDYCFGDTVTMADVFLLPQMWNARRFGCDVTPYANLTRIEARLYEHPAIDTARPENQPDAV